MTWPILSAGAKDDDSMFEDELRAMSVGKKEKLLHDAGINHYQHTTKARVAMKSMLGIPWYPLVSLGTPWYPLVSLGTPWYPLVSLGTPWYPLVSLGTPWYPLVQAMDP